MHDPEAAGALGRIKSSRSPTTASNAAIINGMLVIPPVTKRDRSKTQADYFEKYIVEKTKNERLLGNLERMGI
jgi:hypothetical protein